jgi:hypothetical protein
LWAGSAQPTVHKFTALRRHGARRPVPDKSGKVLPPCIELALPYPDVLANRFK